MSERQNKLQDPELQQLLDRQAILDCIHRYCRGVDRFDRDLLKSAYHDDAIDDHGVYCGPVDGFIDWALDLHQQQHATTHHSVFNHSCEIVGDTAHTETYYMFVANNRQGPVSLHYGRYIDRFEKRRGRWAIAERVCLVDCAGVMNPDLTPPEFIAAMTGNAVNARDRSDVSYMRPLKSRGRR